MYERTTGSIHFLMLRLMIQKMQYCDWVKENETEAGN